MLDSLKAGQWSWSKVQRREPWTLDRNWHRSEGERQLKARNYTQAEFHLAFAIEDADGRGASATQRIRLRLELAETQRRRAAPPADGTEPDREVLETAEKTIRGAIEIAAATSNANEYVNCLDALGEVFLDVGYWAALETVSQDAIRLGAALPHPDPLRMARRVHALGIARLRSGRLEEAMPVLEKAILMHQDCYGESVVTAHLLAEVGRVYRAQGNHSKAQEHIGHALRIHESACGDDSPEACHDLQQLGGSLAESGDTDAAAEQYERALARKLRKLGVEHLEEVAEMQFSLATLYTGWGNLPRARELLAECVGSFLGRGGPRLAVTYELLAQVEERSGRFHAALRELEHAGQAWEECGPQRAPELIRNLEYRTDLLEQLRKTREASWLRERIAALKGEPPAQAQIA